MSEYWDGLMNWNCEGYQANKKREKMINIKYYFKKNHQVYKNIITYNGMLELLEMTNEIDKKRQL